MVKAVVGVGVVKVGPGRMGNPCRVVKVSPLRLSASPEMVKSPSWWASWWKGQRLARFQVSVGPPSTQWMTWWHSTWATALQPG